MIVIKSRQVQISSEQYYEEEIFKEPAQVGRFTRMFRHLFKIPMLRAKAKLPRLNVVSRGPFVLSMPNFHTSQPLFLRFKALESEPPASRFCLPTLKQAKISIISLLAMKLLMKSPLRPLFLYIFEMIAQRLVEALAFLVGAFGQYAVWVSKTVIDAFM